MAKKRAPAKAAPYDRTALVLQGGGALGAFQAGVYQALAEANLQPDWVAGTSIGAINAALIAGNSPAERCARLDEFWRTVSSNLGWNTAVTATPLLDHNELVRTMFNNASSTLTMLVGQRGFFRPRMPSPWLWPAGSAEATSHYDTAELRRTLERLVDFDRINAGEMRFSVGAVNVRTGNFTNFDNTRQTISAAHVMASGALPPGFPAIEIDGEYFWDGGLLSNTPLQWVLDDRPRVDTLVFQVDLWSARGELPRDLAEVNEREKDIRYSSRTRLNTDQFREVQNLRHAIAKLLDKLPAKLQSTPEARLLHTAADPAEINIVHLIYKNKSYENYSKDYEFSESTMLEHWRCGHHDMEKTLHNPSCMERPVGANGVVTHDLT